MGDFAASWLALREPADTRARSADLARDALAACTAAPVLDAIDLGCGTGANTRYLIGLSAAPQRWLLVDRDPQLLGEVPRVLAQWARGQGSRVGTTAAGVTLHRPQGGDVALRTRAMELTSLTPAAVPDGVHLVTASALLDLVSARWLEALAAACAGASAVGLFALTYDGRIICTPPDPDDDEVRSLVNQHQHGDKGFGPATGPDASAAAARAFAAAGYEVRRVRSDWQLPPSAAELQAELIDGWAAAAAQAAPLRAGAIDAWRRRRRAHVAAHQSGIVVGHEDMLAVPALR